MYKYKYIYKYMSTCLDSVSLFSEELDIQRAWYMASVYGTDSGLSCIKYMQKGIGVCSRNTLQRVVQEDVCVYIHVHVHVPSLEL